MRILDLVQGSQAWHEARAARFTASEAPAMMGASKYQKRSELLHMKATGLVAEVSEHQQKIFNKGHKAEELARPLAEEIIGEELFPATAMHDDISLNLLASFDGITMLEDVCWEHKLLNQKLFAAVQAEELEAHYYWQLEQQLLVSGADQCLFMCSDGTKENMASMWYTSIPGRREELLAGWNQFAEDLRNYTPAEATVEVVAATQKELPVLTVDIAGEVKSSNLTTFKDAVTARIEAVKTDLTTDQDFADADATVKFFDKGEKQLEQVKAQALAQTESISVLFNTIDELKESMRKKRLELNKLVKARKEQLRSETIMTAKRALDQHIAELNRQLGQYGFMLPTITADFATAIKGKKTITSVQSAADDELAKNKAMATQQAEGITAKAILLNKLSAGFEHLFADRCELVMLSEDHLKDKVNSRISAHKEKERQRQEQERQRIQAEEEAKAKREAEAKLEQEREKIRLEEQARIRKEQEKAALAAKVESQPAQQAEPATLIQQPVQQEAQTASPRFAAPTRKAAEAMVAITNTEYMELKQARDMLEALQAHGVDNWSGYSDAISSLGKAA